MRKRILLSVFVIVIAGALFNQEFIHQTYLKLFVNKNLTVDETGISYCGHAKEEGETALQLVRRVGHDFAGNQAYRELSSAANTVFKDTDEIELINEKIKAWGWQDDDYLAEKIAMYEGTSYGKKELAKLLSIKKLRETAGYTKEQLLDERDELRKVVYRNHKDEHDKVVTEIIERLACITDDESIKAEKAIFTHPYNPTMSEEQKKHFEKLYEKRSEIAFVESVKPLEQFTLKIKEFLDDAVMGLTVLDSSITTDEFFIANELTLVSSNTFGTKKRYLLTCKAIPLGLNPVFFQARLQDCHFREADEQLGTYVFLDTLDMSPEEFENEPMWKELKAVLLSEF